MLRSCTIKIDFLGMCLKDPLFISSNGKIFFPKTLNVGNTFALWQRTLLILFASIGVRFASVRGPNKYVQEKNQTIGKN